VANRWALFDMDGVLTDSSEGIVRCYQHALATVGIDGITDASLKSRIGPPLQDVFVEFGVELSQLGAVVTAFRARFVERGMLIENKLIPGISEVLGSLAADGWTLAVATSKPFEFAEKIVTHFGIGHYFSFVAGATLDGTRRAKADVIAFALAELAADPSRTCMIGDRREDLIGADANGIFSIAAAWGFGDPTEFVADRLIGVAHAPNELSDLLARELPS
jgi:phosphoglycolate phosphatase